MKYGNETARAEGSEIEVVAARQRDTENAENLEMIGYEKANSTPRKFTETRYFPAFLRDPTGAKTGRHTTFWALFWALLIFGGVMFATSLIGPKDCRPGSLRATFTNCD